MIAQFVIQCKDRLGLIKDLEIIIQAEKQAYADELAHPNTILSLLYVRDPERCVHWIEDQTVLAMVTPGVTGVRVIELLPNI